MLTRRHLLRSSALLSLAPTVPGFLARLARAADAPGRDGRILVVLQLEGGNDGINTVVPFGDEAYARHRKTLRIGADRLLKINDGVGLHPAMRAAGTLLETGRLAIVPGVGLPNPDRSHFSSMATWQAARLDPADTLDYGWVGRALDSAPTTRDGSPGSLLVGPDQPPVALLGRRSVAAAIDRLDDFASPGAAPGPGGPDPLGRFLERTLLDAHATAGRIEALAKAPDRAARYPEGTLADRLRLTARLIKAGLGTRVYYAVQAGYDTHGGQANPHAELLTDLSAALLAFLDDLAASGLADRVLVVAFSEFGRRVAENGSAGTDHGTSGPVFLAGPGVAPGLHGAYPRLDDLVDGDLRTPIDFRRVYATLLESWLGLPSAGPLAGRFDPLPLLRG